MLPRPPDPGRSPLVIVGGSTRAAAHSVIRCGWSPLCADLFADADLLAFATVLPVNDYPAGLIAALATVPDSVPLLYTGGVENHPDLLAELTRRRPLFGNPPKVLRRVRDPFQVHAALQSHGLPALAVHPGTHTPSQGEWMSKPLASAGGRDVQRLLAVHCPLSTAHYLQQFQPGDSYSALFCTVAGRSTLLGAARQLRSSDPDDFRFQGAIAPWPLADLNSRLLQQIGDVLTRAFDLRGLFGIDFILHKGQPWVVEVNPRYTATVELFEYAWQQSLLVPEPQPGPDAGRVFAKQIVYATEPTPTQPPTGVPREITFDPPPYVDLPTAGQVIPAGQPICTWLGSFPSAAAAWDELRSHPRSVWSNAGTAQ